MSEFQPPRFHTGRPYDHSRLTKLPFAANDDLVALVKEVFEQSKDCAPFAASNNPYALMPDTLAFLEALLTRTLPELIVEFGSGQSTQLFSSWAARNGKRLISVEHDRDWINKVDQDLPAPLRSVVTLVHAPLHLKRHGLREFFTYDALNQLVLEIRRADFFLLDGPHVSGREDVLYFVLCRCHVGAIVVIDDLRSYSIGEMLDTLPRQLAQCFAITPIDENSHGLAVLRCVSTPSPAPLPTISLRSVLRSYWRCFLDYRNYGTGC